MLKFAQRRCFSKDVGSMIHGWKLNKSEYIPEFKFTTYELKHEKTGAEYFHVDAKDHNNFFSISFTTPPSDSKGIPHVLEHTGNEIQN
jgi:presequence protease